MNRVTQLRSRAARVVATTDDSVSNIKVARIEAAASSRFAPQVCVTFQIDRDTVSFQVPIRLSVSNYDDTKMIQAARNALHRTFAELSVQSRDGDSPPKTCGSCPA
jgi:hypothetical protein